MPTFLSKDEVLWEPLSNDDLKCIRNVGRGVVDYEVADHL
jgi:hypothetical protein